MSAPKYELIRDIAGVMDKAAGEAGADPMLIMAACGYLIAMTACERIEDIDLRRMLLEHWCETVMETAQCKHSPKDFTRAPSPGPNGSTGSRLN